MNHRTNCYPALPDFVRYACCIALALITGISAYCQGSSCAGSLGDPIVNVTFGAGANYGPPLSSTTSDLTYTPSSCPQDGNYGIVNYTSNCANAGGNWHTLTDHTGDPNGYFMMVNASFQPSNFYVQTISGLCERTSYRFAAWLVNICSMHGILPNITFNIEKTDGTVLQTYNSGDIPITNPATWKQYGFDFSTPAGVSTVILRMRNNAPGGGGNDVALDDITFRPVGASVKIAATGYTGSQLTVCAGNPDVLLLSSAIENCYPSTAYQWQLSTDSGATWKNLSGNTGAAYSRPPTPVGMYWYRVLVAPGQNIAQSTCRTASEPVQITVLNIPKPQLAARTEICLTDTLLLNPGKFDTYRWQDGSATPQFSVHAAGTYTVTVGNLCGTGTASALVAQRSCAVMFPSAFSPDGNGRNDLFKILHADHLAGYHLRVFNRWGQKVYETHEADRGWDGRLNGRPADGGMYVWVCEMQQQNTPLKTTLKGTVMLMR